MAIGNSIPIDVSLLQDLEQSALQLSSQLDTLLSGLQSHLQQVNPPPPPNCFAREDQQILGIV